MKNRCKTKKKKFLKTLNRQNKNCSATNFKTPLSVHTNICNRTFFKDTERILNKVLVFKASSGLAMVINNDVSINK